MASPCKVLTNQIITGINVLTLRSNSCRFDEFETLIGIGIKKTAWLDQGHAVFIFENENSLQNFDSD